MVDILMAVYNGEKFVAEQIDSILAQSETYYLRRYVKRPLL